jgi:hypothetical protein
MSWAKFWSVVTDTGYDDVTARRLPLARAPLEAAVDFGAHDAAVGRGMVVATEQRAGEVFPSELQLFDLRLSLSAALARSLSTCDTCGVEDAFDLVEREARVLHHPDEHQSAQRRFGVAALPERRVSAASRPRRS